MFKYKPQKQLSIFDFQTVFERKLNPENRWVKMARILDWDKLATVYAKTLSSRMGAGSIDARIVIGALIIKHLEKKDDRGGYYPELVQTDDIYMSRANRTYLKERHIRHTGRPLGRKPKKEKQSRYQRQKQKKEKNERNHVEGKFGQGKAGYNMNRMMARLASTHQSWVASIVFVMNILRAMQDLLCQIFKKLFVIIHIEEYRINFPGYPARCA